MASARQLDTHNEKTPLRLKEEHFDVCWNIRADQRTTALCRDRRCIDFEELSREADLSPRLPYMSVE